MRRLALALCALAVTGAALAAGDAGLLPGPGAVPGWRPDGNAKVFTGSGLYGHIDGGAEIFFEFGFEELTVQRYARGTDGVELELYRMRDPAAALGIYLGRCGRETPDPDLRERHTAGRHELMLVRERYFLIAANLDGSPAVAPQLVAFARAVAAALPPAQPVAVLELLPHARRVAGSERLIRGALALQSIITLGEADVLQLGGRNTAAAAAYDAGEGRPACTLVVAEYPDDATALRVLAHLTDGLDPEVKPLRREPDRLVFRDYGGRFGEARAAGRRLTLTLNLEREP